MTHPHASVTPTPAERREGFLAGAVLGAALAARTAGARDPEGVLARLGDAPLLPVAAPAGRRRAATALADALLEELTGAGVDLRRLAGRWTDWWREDGLEASPALAAALDHLRDFDAPIETLPASGPAALAAALPAGLAGASPQGMIRGAFHVARLVDPGEEAGLASVAVVVAASRLLEGHRDFVADVIAALRVNDPPAPLLEAVRGIPRDPRTPPPLPRGVDPAPLTTLTWLLWVVHHRPRAVDILTDMVRGGGVAPEVGALAGALLGARDGIHVFPEAWLQEGGEDVVLRRALARRLP